MADEQTKAEILPPMGRNAKGQFVAGHCGNGGRPKGSRNKLGEAFLADMLADWEIHGAETVAKVREERPADYLKVVASILPKDLHVRVGDYEDATDDEILERIRELSDAVGPLLDAGRTRAIAGRSKTKATH